MKGLMRAGLIAAGGLLMCAAQDAGPAAGTAQITFVKGYDKGYSVVAASEQSYFRRFGPRCNRKKGMAGFNMLRGGEKTVSVPAGALQSFGAIAKRKVLTARATCQSRVSFVPEAGHHYRFTQVARVGQDCHIEVVDLANNAAPTDLEYNRTFPCAAR